MLRPCRRASPLRAASQVSASPPMDRENGEAAGAELAGMVAYALLNAPPERVQALTEKLSGDGAEQAAAAMLDSNPSIGVNGCRLFVLYSHAQ